MRPPLRFRRRKSGHHREPWGTVAIRTLRRRHSLAKKSGAYIGGNPRYDVVPVKLRCFVIATGVRLITSESATDVVITVKISKALLARARRLFEQFIDVSEGSARDR